ncbi:MAG: 50S ribosomal protein L29 [Candidatus Taylorbacteria bacterium RIFCSPLOWO2_02_FULL_43_11]|uniref:Large ribosomal subunit protein uL29 n=1 Tax=Candidatus Taylorbacteria bacterium RIFCSPHIGHO2_02_FULL_43_32b TaxID=1802306 RepID=A0A1G2MHF0_9BACT|nr:MAG: 50S ribosomal protein L29 [Candidatus Taylorbacteria bacterium RIFCSPHIGHO2_01_FULL_43_47]OHA23298.1 MAG: 50S ribosomal protein L29 [Candidatus Taylorbacteria bacterium RIFCSPHIGHO2_02_FULL_43_32b]OHA30166.1 MAG: 50S ribosomal protein L29 [Candidatus Taylorbacteria bacterium RIFCSPLOWO2_01_FULL_43_44]OHA36025.1 MAG: 50S ribosomal protein L29 [Candidatus Taylorbacteria bacterium RIFCSPLOWO2_02_FULL_43_11]
MKELVNKNSVELQKLLAEKREELRKFRFEMSGGKVKNVKQSGVIKKDVARILTILRNVKE